jgi:hypothetical protein
VVRGVMARRSCPVAVRIQITLRLHHTYSVMGITDPRMHAPHHICVDMTRLFFDWRHKQVG